MALDKETSFTKTKDERIIPFVEPQRLGLDYAAEPPLKKPTAEEIESEVSLL